MPFFRADMAGLVKYCMGGYGRIGVYIDNCDELCVYRSEDISGPKGGTYMFNTSS